MDIYMKKKIIFIFIALLLKSFSFSQVSISPDDEFYIDVTGWLLKGIIYYVPQTKPYPVNTVKSILNKVLDSDSESDVKKAEYYCSKYFGKNWKFSLKADFQEVLRSIQDAETVNNEKYDLNFYATGDFDFGKYIGFSYKTGLNFFNTNDDKNLLMPYGRFDSSKVIIDGFSLYNENLALTFDLNASVSFGTERNYISLGVNKNSYGPFSDSSVTLNEQAYQSLNVFKKLCEIDSSFINRFKMLDAMRLAVVSNSLSILVGKVFSIDGNCKFTFENEDEIKSLLPVEDKEYFRNYQDQCICLIPRDFFTLLVTDKRVNETTLNTFLSNQNGRECVWYHAFPYLIDEAYKNGNDKLLLKLLDISRKNNCI